MEIPVDCQNCPERDVCFPPETSETEKERKSMITVNNAEVVEATKPICEIEAGAAFVGTVEDVDGVERSGLFLRTHNSVVLVEDPSYEFETTWEGDTFGPKVENFKWADITVTVDDAWSED